MLRVFASAQQAHFARGLLETHGIRATVTGDQLTDTLSIYGHAVAKVELLVDASQYELAAQLLNEALVKRAPHEFDRWGIAEVTHWRCSACEEINGPAFDECWDCGTPRPDAPEMVPPDFPDQPMPDGTSQRPEAQPISDSPYRAPETAITQASQSGLSLGDHDPADRAMRAAIISLLFPLPIAFVGFYYCVQSWGRTQKSGKSLAATLICMPLAIFALFLGLHAVVQISRAL